MTRDDLKRFQALDIDFSTIGLMQEEDFAYFCTPVGAEYVGWVGCDGIHFVLLPGDERVFCIDPSMEYSDTCVLLVGSDFREFLSFVLYCQGSDRLSQIHWMGEDAFRQSLEDDREWARKDRALSARKDAALSAVAAEFTLSPADPYEKVKALQAAFDPSVLRFSDEYYDTLGLERPG